MRISVIVVLFCVYSSSYSVNWKSFEYTKWFMQVVKERVSPGSTILQFGSSWLSEELSKVYTVYTVEHDEYWIGKYNTKYLYVPLKNGWYDVSLLAQLLPKQYDCIFIDGFSGYFRHGFFDNLKLFNDVPLLVDGLFNSYDITLVTLLARKRKRKEEIVLVENSPLLAYI